ncbi:MAG TPA: enoyl-CoA hydratase/isomerase family protein [Solirubrobacteraceae bacterium]|nr:enoyl-CoA hydratase/isomerase family protein [Solirubrobacteraceae bacterium]
MAFTTIEVSAAGNAGTITLNRPEKLNPLSAVTLRELAEAARWLDGQPEVKVVVVAGKGRAFSAGADVSVFAAAAEAGPIATRRAADAGRIMAEAVEDMSAITIARIQGHCIGGGVVLAAACDLRVAAETTRFSIPEVDLGIPLAWGGIPRLVREIGPAMTKELVLTCRPFTAEEAQELGFVNRVVAEEQLGEAVDELAAQLLRKSSLALAVTKRAVNSAASEVASTAGAWTDADSLLTALSDPDSRRAAADYLHALGRRAVAD